jgi:hypothetical protein
MPEIDIEQFIREEVVRLANFRDMWNAGRRSDPEVWPEKMPPGEWDEQYRGFIE